VISSASLSSAVFFTALLIWVYATIEFHGCRFIQDQRREEDVLDKAPFKGKNLTASVLGAFVQPF